MLQVLEAPSKKQRLEEGQKIIGAIGQLQWAVSIKSNPMGKEKGFGSTILAEWESTFLKYPGGDEDLAAACQFPAVHH